MSPEVVSQEPTYKPPTLFRERPDFANVEVLNLTGLPDYDPKIQGELAQWLRGIRARKLILYPDISPTGPGLVPTGCLAEFDTTETPNWLEYVQGADIGCGMLLATLPLKTADFRLGGQRLLDEIARELISQSDNLGLGGGNHFLDLIDMEGTLGYLIHTGSFGDLQNPLGKLVSDPEAYFKMYPQVIAAAQSNRRKIAAIINKILGTEPRTTSDTMHNRVEVSGSTALVYKGVVKVTDLEAVQIIPTSMNSPVLAVKPGRAVSAVTHWGISHGSGRAVKRSDANAQKTEMAAKYRETDDGKIAASNFGLMVPVVNGRPLRLPISELPQMYYESGIALDRLESTGLAGETVGLWSPIAYIGHLPKN